MASSPITSWQIDGETMETVTDFIFLGLQITADGDCSHEVKRRLLLGRKAMTNLDSILKSRHYFADKGPSSQRKLKWSCSVVSDSLQPGTCSNSRPLSRWCHPTISSFVIPFSSCFQSFSAPRSFPMSRHFTSGGQSIGALASASVLSMNI